MLRDRSLVAQFTLMVLAAGSVASGASPQATPKPPASTQPSTRCLPFPSNESGFLEGRWAGQGKLEMTGRPISSTLVVNQTSDGEGLHLTEEELPPNRTKLDALWSRDCGSGDLVMFIAGNVGAGARLFRSRGFSDGKVTFESDPSLRAWFALERFTFSRTEDGRIEQIYEMSRDGSTWHVGDRQIFSKG